MSETSKRPEIQAKIEQKKDILKKKYPNTDESLINEQARDRVAAELTRERLRKEIQVQKGRAITDGLTGFLNNDGFEEMLQREGLRVQKTGKSMAVVMLDVNDLKIVNNRQGHPAGDRFLKKIAEVLDKSTRQSDVKALTRTEEDKTTVARWGGDEFGVVLIDTDAEGASAWWLRTSEQLEKGGISIGAGLRMITPEELKGQSPTQVKETISERKEEADLALMMMAKPQSKAEKRPILSNYETIPLDIRSAMKKSAIEMKTAVTQNG